MIAISAVDSIGSESMRRRCAHQMVFLATEILLYGQPDPTLTVDDSNQEMFMHELRVWFGLNRRHALWSVPCWKTGECAANGTLRDCLARQEPSGRSVVTWGKLYEVAVGFQYSHDQNIIHNDLKCDNFLVSADEKAKITDFGLGCIPNSAEIQIDPKQQQDAQQWKSSECLRGDRSTLASDVYSLGICILGAVTGTLPWWTTSDVFVRRNLQKGLLPSCPRWVHSRSWRESRRSAISTAQLTSVSILPSELFTTRRHAGSMAVSQAAAAPAQTPALASPSEATRLLHHHAAPPAQHQHGHKRLLPQLSTQGVIILVCLINLLNYVDRGIIPGTPQQFQNFISETLHIDVTQQSFYLGVLASSFVASYSICSMLFGYLALTHRPFRTIAFGMSVWVIAVIVCGLAKRMESYYMLLFGRILSGVGEASFQCNATPFIDSHAPKESRALYMGIFLASITVGTALGYIYGSSFAASELGWEAAYYVEAALMVCLILACLFCVPQELDVVPNDHSHDIPHAKNSAAAAVGSRILTAEEIELMVEPPPRKSFFAEWCTIFSNPTFALVVLGHAAYTFSLAALSVFSPVIFIGLGLFETETQVSVVFGALIVITGTIGTPIGGIFVDWLLKRDSVTKDMRCFVSVSSLFYFAVIAEVLALTMMAFTDTKLVFLGFLGLCFFFLCALSPAETIAVMELFPESRRAMAIAANTLIIHVLGDVPSPVILGYLKDSWAPRCGTIEVNDEVKLNPECWKDHSGLLDVLLFAVLWLVWAVLLWGIALIVLKRSQRSKARFSLQA
ncbi:Major facilitator superfamily, partial [Globisporangium splendens]